MVQVPEGTAVSTQGQHYVQLKEGHAYQRRFFKLSSGCLHFSKLGNFFLLDLASIKTLLAVAFYGGCEKQIFLSKNESMKSATACCQCHQPQ